MRLPHPGQNLGVALAFPSTPHQPCLLPSQEMIPFAVVGSDHEYQVNGKRILGRKTKWGTIEGTCHAGCWGQGQGSTWAAGPGVCLCLGRAPVLGCGASQNISSDTFHIRSLSQAWGLGCGHVSPWHGSAFWVDGSRVSLLATSSLLESKCESKAQSGLEKPLCSLRAAWLQVPIEKNQLCRCGQIPSPLGPQFPPP